MNAPIHFVERFDTNAGLFDSASLGPASFTRDGFVRFDRLGTELHSTPLAVDKIARAFARRWDMAPSDAIVRDAAVDFTSSKLEKILGPGAEVRRGQRPYLFVPGEGRELALPSRNLLEPGWKINSYEVVQPTGQADWVEPHSVRKLQHADFQVEKMTNGAEYYGAKYMYTIPETWEADKLGVDVIDKRSSSATWALDNFRERVSGFGDQAKALPGLFTLGTALLTNGGAPFSSGTPDAVTQMRVLQSLEDLYFRANNETLPTRMVAPRSDFSAMRRTYFGTGGEGPSVWERASQEFEWVRNAMWTERLDTGSANGLNPRWVIYAEDNEELYVEHTESMVFGPFQDYMNFEFVILRRHGGVVSRRPERVLYADFND